MNKDNNEQNANCNPGMPKEQSPKSAIIQHQVNNNCQQFFGPVTGSVFAMPGATVTQQVAPPASAPAPTKAKATPRRGAAPYATTTTFDYRYRNTRQGRLSLITLYKALLATKMIAQDTRPEDFEAIFGGEASTARVKWTGAKSCLWYLLKTMRERGLISMCQGIWLIASSHFVDEQNREFGDLNKQKIPKKQVQALDCLVGLLEPSKGKLGESDDTYEEPWAGIRDRAFEMNRRSDR